MPVGTTFTAGFQTANVETAAQFAKCMSAYAWSNCVWDGGYRVKKGFIGASWFALDFDSPEMTLEEAKRTFCDMTHVIGTTRNHQKEKDGIKCDRFRVVIKAERIMRDVNEYEFNMRKMTDRYPIDRACVDGARHYFKCSDIVQIVDDGYPEEVLEYEGYEESAEEKAKRLRETRASYRVFGKLPDWVEDFLTNGVTKDRHETALRASIIMVEHGIPREEILNRISAAPISRSWTADEVPRMVQFAERIIGS